MIANSASEKVSNCKQCGAPLRSGEACIDLFNRMLAVEWVLIGALGAAGPKALPADEARAIGTRAHFLAVGSYQLQHPDGLTADALLGLHAAMVDVLAGRRAVADVRLDARRAHDGPQRVRRRPEEGGDPRLGPWPSAWPVTVADCCDVAPEDYAEAARRLAAATAEAIDAVRSAAPAPQPPRRPVPRRPRGDRRLP